MLWIHIYFFSFERPGMYCLNHSVTPCLWKLSPHSNIKRKCLLLRYHILYSAVLQSSVLYFKFYIVLFIICMRCFHLVSKNIYFIYVFNRQCAKYLTKLIFICSVDEAIYICVSSVTFLSETAIIYVFFVRLHIKINR